MTNTSLVVPPQDQDRYAQGYDAKLQPAIRFPTNVWPSAGSLRSTIPDMMRYLRATLQINGSPALESAVALTDGAAATARRRRARQ